MVEEDGVHGLADGLLAAEGEGKVGDAARDAAAGARLLDPLARADEVDAVVVVLAHAGGDREDVGVEDDVVGVEADLLDQDLVRPLADGHLRILVGSLGERSGAVSENAPTCQIESMNKYWY